MPSGLLFILFSWFTLAHAGVREFFSEANFLLWSGRNCSRDFDEFKAKQKVSEAIQHCPAHQLAIVNGEIQVLAQLSHELEGNAEDQFFALLAKKNVPELICSADFAKQYAKDATSLLQGVEKLKSLREFRQSWLKSVRALAKNPTVFPKICPSSISELKPNLLLTHGRDEYFDYCQRILTYRSAYESMLASFPLNNSIRIKNFLKNFSEMSDGPEQKKREAQILQELKEAYLGAEVDLKHQAEKLDKKVRAEGGRGFDRSERYDLLSDPLLVKRSIEEAGNGGDIQGLACYADARYKQGADDFDKSLTTGALVLGPGLKLLGKGFSVFQKVIMGTSSARRAGLISLNASRILQGLALSADGLVSINYGLRCLPDDGPELKVRGRNSKGECLAAPSFDQLRQDDCLLTLGLTGLGVAVPVFMAQRHASEIKDMMRTDILGRKLGKHGRLEIVSDLSVRSSENVLSDLYHYRTGSGHETKNIRIYIPKKNGQRDIEIAEKMEMVLGDLNESLLKNIDAVKINPSASEFGVLDSTDKKSLTLFLGQSHIKRSGVDKIAKEVTNDLASLMASMKFPGGPVPSEYAALMGRWSQEFSSHEDELIEFLHLYLKTDGGVKDPRLLKKFEDKFSFVDELLGTDVNVRNSLNRKLVGALEKVRGIAVQRIAGTTLITHGTRGVVLEDKNSPEQESPYHSDVTRQMKKSNLSR